MALGCPKQQENVLHFLSCSLFSKEGMENQVSMENQVLSGLWKTAQSFILLACSESSWSLWEEWDEWNGGKKVEG